jgi:hypothetical protein
VQSECNKSALNWRCKLQILPWEFRKNHKNIGEWFDFVDKPDDWRWTHFEQWSLQKYGSRVRASRNSVAALLDGNEFYAMICEYRNLCSARRVRRAAAPVRAFSVLIKLGSAHLVFKSRKVCH